MVRKKAEKSKKKLLLPILLIIVVLAGAGVWFYSDIMKLFEKPPEINVFETRYQSRFAFFRYEAPTNDDDKHKYELYKQTIVYVSSYYNLSLDTSKRFYDDLVEFVIRKSFGYEKQYPNRDYVAVNRMLLDKQFAECKLSSYYISKILYYFIVKTKYKFLIFSIFTVENDMEEINKLSGLSEENENAKNKFAGWENEMKEKKIIPSNFSVNDLKNIETYSKVVDYIISQYFSNYESKKRITEESTESTETYSKTDLDMVLMSYLEKESLVLKSKETYSEIEAIVYKYREN